MNIDWIQLYVVPKKIIITSYNFLILEQLKLQYKKIEMIAALDIKRCILILLAAGIFF